MANMEQTQTGWDAYATAYDEALTPHFMRFANDALRIAGVEQRTKLLDIAAGGGALSVPAAQLGADVLAVDFSPAMVQLLSRKVREQGLSNLEVRFMDGTALDLEDGIFDVACSQLGIMLFPDRRRGLSEMARVVRPGGKGVMAVFGPRENVEIFHLFFEAVRKIVPAVVQPEKSPLFSLQRADRLRMEMEEAGFKEVRVETLQHYLDIASGDQLWNILRSSAPATAGMLRQMTDEQQAAAQATLGELLASRGRDGATELATTMHVAVGMK